METTSFEPTRGDHPPYHVHIRKDGREIGRWDIENQRKMDEFRLTREICEALIALGYWVEEDR